MTHRRFPRSLLLPLVPLVLAAACDSHISARGRILSDNGEPVAGARVLLGRSGDVELEAESDENGCFELSSLVSPGKRSYDFEVSSVGHEPATDTFRNNFDYLVLVRLAASGSRSEVTREECPPLTNTGRQSWCDDPPPELTACWETGSGSDDDGPSPEPSGTTPPQGDN